jgi:hypothetical protein
MGGYLARENVNFMAHLTLEWIDLVPLTFDLHQSPKNFPSPLDQANISQNQLL